MELASKKSLTQLFISWVEKRCKVTANSWTGKFFNSFYRKKSPVGCKLPLHRGDGERAW